MKVNTLGLLFAAQRLETAAAKLDALEAAVLQPLAADGTSAGAAGRLDAASTELLASTTAQAASLHEVAAHLMLIAAKFATQEEINKAHLDYLNIQASAMDDAALTALTPVPPLPPDVRLALPPAPPVAGELFSQQIHNGSASRATGFNTTATNNGSVANEVAVTVREVAASVPDYWDSPVGTDALAGRLNEYGANLNAVSDRWFELGDGARKHADDYSQTVSATPKPHDFQDARDAFARASAANDPVGMSQAQFTYGQLQARASAEEARYAGITETSTAPAGAGTPQPTGAGAGGAPAAAGAAPGERAAAVPGQAQLAKAGAAEAGQAGQAGEGAGQLAQMLPSALGAIGGLAGGVAGMAGQVPQALMQTGQGLAQAATQGMSGLASKNPAAAEPATSVGAYKSEELSRATGGGAGGDGGAGATHPAGALGPPVTPSTSHTPPTMPSGGAPPPAAPTATGGSAMGGTPMGMPMGAMMPHGQGGGDGPEKVAADKKVVTPPQPHTEPVTGKVSDRTAAAAEASRSRSHSDADDDQPPRGPVLRRITLAPLNDDRT